MAWQARKWFESTGLTEDLGTPTAALSQAANAIVVDAAAEVFTRIDSYTGRGGAKAVAWNRKEPVFTSKMVVKGDTTIASSITARLVGPVDESDPDPANHTEDSYWYAVIETPQIRVQKTTTLTGDVSNLPGVSGTVALAVEKICQDMADEMWAQLQQYGAPDPVASEFETIVKHERGQNVVYTIIEV